MQTLTVEEAQKQLGQILSKAVSTQEKCRISSEEGNIVLMPEEHYEQLMITLEWLATTSLFSEDESTELEIDQDSGEVEETLEKLSQVAQ